VERKTDAPSSLSRRAERGMKRERRKTYEGGGGACGDESAAPDAVTKSRQMEKKTAHQSWRNGAKTKHKSPDFLLNPEA
ncbi:hypothetical protein, partial [Porphyromonas loveana]|uniref:hypothetical protein n=1 Tax=Porphyromonas loveana TaxID=1884669 RepID=UPI0035A062F3